MEQLRHYDWPGNVRELENAIERAVVLSKSRTLKAEDFAFLHTPSAPRSGTLSLKEMEVEYIREVLEDSDWNITRAAKVLGLNRVTLHKKINRYNLKRGA
jgi:two-component system response regulator HydG